MKITIEGEPKEIAAYELALKDGNKSYTISNTISKPLDKSIPVECPNKWD